MPLTHKDHTKKRVSKACDCCRKSKTKCDGQRPCTRCLQDGKICTYMTKKKAGQVYPAAYVDLLETRVSVLVQTLTQLLEKSKEGSDELYAFCSDDDLLNSEGEWDINKVIGRLLPSERLQNLAESSENYSLHDITDVTGSPTSTHTQEHAAPSRSPSPRAMHSSHNHHHSTHSSKGRRYSDNHIHKIPSSRLGTSNSSSASSLQSRLSLSANSPSTSHSDSPLSTSLDIFKPPNRANTLDSILSEKAQELELDVNFSDTNTGSTLMSPVYSIDDVDLNSNKIQSLDSAFQDLFPVQTGLQNTNLNDGVSFTVSESPVKMPVTAQSILQNSNTGSNYNIFGGFDWDFDDVTVKKEPITLDQSFDQF